MSRVFKFNNGRVQSLRTVRLFLRSVITSKFFKYLNASFSISLMLLNPRSSCFKLTKPAKCKKHIRFYQKFKRASNCQQFKRNISLAFKNSTYSTVHRKIDGDLLVNFSPQIIIQNLVAKSLIELKVSCQSLLLLLIMRMVSFNWKQI